MIRSDFETFDFFFTILDAPMVEVAAATWTIVEEKCYYILKLARAEVVLFDEMVFYGATAIRRGGHLAATQFQGSLHFCSRGLI